LCLAWYLDDLGLQTRKGLALTPTPHLDDVSPRTTALIQRELEKRRFSALVAAIREHEARAAVRPVRERPHDQALYRRVLQLSGRGR
jgi:hypothetical protein